MARSTFVFRRRETPVATLPLRASRFTVSQVEGRTRFGLTPLDAVRDIKAANARGGRRGATSRRRKPRVVAFALALTVFLVAVAAAAQAQALNPKCYAADAMTSQECFAGGSAVTIAPASQKCYAALRDALIRAQEYVRDPDETVLSSSDSLYRAPCRICALRAEIERVERKKAAVSAIREALEKCP